MAAAPHPVAPHMLGEQETLAAFDTSRVGLSMGEVARRLERHGENALPEGKRRSAWRMLLDQFVDFMILVLIAAAIVSAVVGEPIDSLAIVVIVVLNGVIGFVQERRAQNAMAALKAMAAHHARVVRDGLVATIEARHLVPGDVVRLEAGDIVPADLRLVEVASLAVGEAALTGESVPVDKALGALAAAEMPVGDRKNMAFKGTIVTGGRGVGVVVATGLATELGGIAALLHDEEETKTPLQRRLKAFGMKLAWAVLAICVVVFLAGLLRGEDPALMFLTAVSLAVAAIPEALPAVVVISLALGAARMVREQALVRRLPAVEALGSVTFVCSDKTGTLTMNRMRVEVVEAADSARRELARAVVLVNDASDPGAGQAMVGDPTEVALLVFGREAGLDPGLLRESSPRVAEVPFDSARKLMTTVHVDGDQFVAYTKGAPEVVLGRCRAVLGDDGEAVFEEAAWRARAEAMASSGLRVLAVATRAVLAPPTLDRLGEVERELTLLGLVGLIDPPRPEAALAVAECKKAGLVPVMITGDHPATALAIARALDIAHEVAEVVTGDELARLDEGALRERVASLRVYARVDPAQKIAIVKALQERGELVAMTGDGVNDAPALKRADIGVAMGKGGTDVAREAAHMVLLDDNFATIVRAIREGRRIFDNIRRFIRYAMTGNSAELWTISLAPFFGLPIPLLPIHILWVNLVTDGLPGLALAVEPAENDAMSRPPRRPGESIFARGLWQHVVWVGLLLAGLCLAVQAIAIEVDAHWQTMVFTVLTLGQLAHVLAIRSERTPLWRLPKNPLLTWTVIGTIGLQLATIYVPPLHDVFKTQTLTALELLVCVAAASLIFFAVELEKAWRVWRERQA